MCFKSKHIFIVTTTNYLIKWTLENFANLQKKIDIFLNSFLFWFVKLSHCSITFGNSFSLSSFNLLLQKRTQGWCSISRLNMINVKFWCCLDIWRSHHYEGSLVNLCLSLLPMHTIRVTCNCQGFGINLDFVTADGSLSMPFLVGFFSTVLITSFILFIQTSSTSTTPLTS